MVILMSAEIVCYPNYEQGNNCQMHSILAQLSLLTPADIPVDSFSITLCNTIKCEVRHACFSVHICRLLSVVGAGMQDEMYIIV